MKHRNDPAEVKARARRERGWRVTVAERIAAGGPHCPTDEEWTELSAIRDGTDDPVRYALVRAQGEQLVIETAQALVPFDIEAIGRDPYDVALEALAQGARYKGGGMRGQG